MNSLLVELQTEELPPKALGKLSEAFANTIAKSLTTQHFLTETSKVTTFGAPRRLAVLITAVLEKSPDEAFKQKLVPVRVGLDAEASESLESVTQSLQSCRQRHIRRKLQVQAG